jgi:hypothetical protein
VHAQDPHAYSYALIITANEQLRKLLAEDTRLNIWNGSVLINHNPYLCADEAIQFWCRTDARASSVEQCAHIQSNATDQQEDVFESSAMGALHMIARTNGAQCEHTKNTTITVGHVNIFIVVEQEIKPGTDERNLLGFMLHYRAMNDDSDIVDEYADRDVCPKW